MLDPIKHKEGCNPANRKTEIIAPVVGMRCTERGAYYDKHDDMRRLLAHTKMFIFERRGYAPTMEKELELLRAEFDRLGF